MGNLNNTAQAVLYQGYGAPAYQPALTSELDVDGVLRKLKEDVVSQSIGARHVPLDFPDVVRLIIQLGVETYGELESFGLQIKKTHLTRGDERFEGHDMYGVATFKSPIDSRFSIASAWKLSDVQKMALWLAVGRVVQTCANGIFSTDGATCFRKNTAASFPAFSEKARALFRKSREGDEVLTHDIEALESRRMTRNEGAAMLGMALNQGVLKPRQAMVAHKEWNEVGSSLKNPEDPRIAEWQHVWRDRTCWRLYNAMTESLKTGSQANYIENHGKVHDFMISHEADMCGKSKQPWTRRQNPMDAFAL